MKRLILTLAILSGITTAHSLTPSPVNVTEQIRKEITYPDAARRNHEEGFVAVNFSVDSVGKVVVKQVHSDNALLKNYVVDKLHKLQLQPDTDEEKDYAVTIEFRLI